VGLTPEFLGRVRLGTSIASLAGVGLYQRYLRTVPIAKILLWTTIASVPVCKPPPLGLAPSGVLSITSGVRGIEVPCRCIGLPLCPLIRGDTDNLSTWLRIERGHRETRQLALYDTNGRNVAVLMSEVAVLMNDVAVLQLGRRS
jgi:hypothetical protein